MATGKKPHKRGVVLGTKTQYLVRVNGEQRLKVAYSKRHDGPATKEMRSLMTRDIGSCIRSRVPMLAPAYLELPEEHLDIVNSFIETYYDIPASEVDMWNFVDMTAAAIYKDWKYDCHMHYLTVSKDVPAEFLGRAEEWDYLKSHFEDPEYLKICERNKSNRNKRKETTLNHHSGPLPLSYRAEQHELKGHKAPEVMAWMDAYGPAKNAEKKVEAVKRKLEEVLLELGDEPGDEEVPAAPIPLDKQIEILESQLVRRHGTTIRGVGRAITRSPKRRGGAKSFKSSAEAEALRQVVQVASEETRKARKETEDLRARMQAMEVAMAAFQTGQVSPAPDISSGASFGNH